MGCHLRATSDVPLGFNGGTCIACAPRSTSLHVFSYLIYKVNKE